MTLQEAAGQLKAVGAEWGTISKNTALATTGTAAFLKEIIAPVGVIYALQKLAAARKGLALKKEDADKLLPSNRLKAVISEMNEIDRKLKPLQAKLAAFTYPLTDKDRENRERIKDKTNPLLDRSDELIDEYRSLKRKIPTENLFAGIETGLKRVEIGWVAAGAIIEQTGHSWYGFNTVVRETNVSLADRNALFAIATNQELRYGKNLGDIALLLNVARESGISMTASLDPMRKKLGDITMGNLAASLDQVIHLSLQAEDALNLTPEAIRNVIDASLQLNRPYQEVLDTITNINQGLGLTGEQSARIVGQITGQAFGFNIHGQAVEAVAKQVARLQAASKGLPVDQDFASRITGGMSDVSTNLGGISTAMGGGRNILQDPKALMRGWEFAANFLRPFQNSIVFKQMAEQMNLTANDAQALIQVVDRMRAGFKDAVVAGQHVGDVAKSQLTLSGEAWGRLWGQIKGAFFQGLYLLTPVVNTVTSYVTALHQVMGEMPETLKTVIKWTGAVIASLAVLAGAIEITAGIYSLAKAITVGNVLVQGLMKLAPVVAPAILSAGATIVSSLMTAIIAAAPVIVAAAGLFLGYELGKALGLGKFGTILGDWIWKGWEVAETAATKVGSTLKTWFTDLFDWLADHIPGLGFLHSKDPGISTHTLSKTQVLASQLSAADNIFGSQDLTVASGSNFLTSQRRELLAALKSGTITPETAKEVTDADAKALNDRINAIVATIAKNKDMPAEQVMEQRKLMQTMIDLLSKLSVTADKDIATYSRQHQDSQRQDLLNRQKADEEAFKSRASATQFGMSAPTLY